MRLSSADNSLRAAPLPNLTALRIFAAMMVVAFHYSLKAGLHGVAAPFFTQGFLGVPLFFVLSGFVLAYSHAQVTQRGRFYLARFARVYPMYVFAFALMTPFALKVTREAGERLEPGSVPAVLLLVQDWFPSLLFFGNPPAWTLSVEAFFYLLFPFLLPLVSGQLRRWRWWIVGLWLLFLIQPILASEQQLALALGVSPGSQRKLLYYCGSPPAFLGEFLMGMFAGAHFRRYPRSFSGRVVLGATLLCVAGFYVSARLPYMTVRNSGIAPILLLLVYVLAGWRSQMLSAKPFQFAGEISYSIYLLQYWVREIFHHVPPALEHARFMVPALLGVSSVTYLYVEKPARNALLRLTRVRYHPEPIPTPWTMP